jgi:hypothetical protein
MTIDIGPATVEFLDQVMPVIVGTRRRSGAVKMNPAWYEFSSGRFWLASFRGAHWLANVERDRAAALLFIDPHDMYRVVHVEAALVNVTAEDGPAQMDRLSHRYTGGPYQFPMSRELVRLQLEPTHVLSSLDQQP